MSLNGYSWVEGNVPNMVDPSGMQSELANTLNQGSCVSINPTLDLPRRCYCYTGLQRVICSLGIGDSCPENIPPSGIPFSINNYSSVVILLGSSLGQQCSSMTVNHSDYWSQGTIVNDGVWTHDHFGTDSLAFSNPQSALDYIRQYDCIAFRGVFKDVALPTQLIELSSRSKEGAILLTNSSSCADRPELLITSVGQPAKETTLNPASTTNVEISYIPGENADCLDWNCIRITQGSLLPTPTNISGRTLYGIQNLNPGVPSPGDSGAGIFVGSQLTGVLQGVDPGTQIPYFQPI